MRVYEVGPFQLHVERRALLHRGSAVAIGAKAVEMLSALIESNSPVTKEALMDRLWPNRFVEESNLAQNVYMLRKVFQRYGCADPIETLPGLGYRIAIPARRLADPAGVPVRRRFVGAAAIRMAVFGAALCCAALAFAIEHPAGGRTSPAALSDEGARLYAIGRYYWNLRTERGIAQSMRYFAAVIDSDPQNPLGYVGMADANESMGDYCYGIHRPDVYFARARAYARQGLQLNPQSAPADATLGFVALHQGQRALAAAELRRAIALDPSYASAHEWYGIALARQRNAAGASAQLHLAARLDPLSVPTMAWLSRLAYRAGRFDEGTAYRKEAFEMSPELSRRWHPPGHPTWASIEDVGPTAPRAAAYTGHEISLRSRSSGADRSSGSGVHAGPDGPYKE